MYIPLGGNRRHVYLNLATIFILTGIWHGAAWQFVLWGIWHGIFVLIERYYKNSKKEVPSRRTKGNFVKWIRNAFGWAYTIFVVDFGWVLFRADGIGGAKRYLLNMIGVVDQIVMPVYSLEWYLDKWSLSILIIASLFAFNLPGRLWDKYAANRISNIYTVVICKYIALLALFAFSAMRIVSGTYDPFIYFRF